MYHDRKVAEIGNNAVSPSHHHKGVGAEMYEFVLDQMKRAGIKPAIVTMGGDDAHAPARRAYEKGWIFRSGSLCQVPHQALDRPRARSRSYYNAALHAGREILKYIQHDRAGEC